MWRICGSLVGLGDQERLAVTYDVSYRKLSPSFDILTVCTVLMPDYVIYPRVLCL
jgi:hypothetical protein